MKKEFINKLYIAFVISMIITIVCCCIAYLWDRKSVDVSFVKDVFSIVISLIAPYVAILLFTDWREQHNKVVNNERTMELIQHLKNFNIVLTQAYIPMGQAINYSKKDIRQYPNKNDLVKEQLDKYIVALNLIIDNSKISYMEASYYVISSNNKESKEIFKKLKDIYDRIEIIKEEFRKMSLPYDYNEEKYKKFEDLDVSFHNIALSITFDILPDLYKTLKEENS